MSLILKNFFFLEDRIGYVAQIFTPAWLAVLMKETDAIRGLQNPTKVSELSSFLIICEYFPRRVPIFECIAASPNWKLEMDQAFHFRRQIRARLEGGCN